ncbi:hypothetical protein ABZ234_03490 [Nocardiopsis sp. NPDC006198]|uniref:hypothetical protein n=1 Tax=Nocardiopsis sp. NPDC006198 TaxID=3154472 RepID=UPI0033B88A87
MTYTDFEKFNALTRQQAAVQDEVDRIGAERARLLAQLHIETGLSYANIGAEVGLSRGTVQQLVERGRKILTHEREAAQEREPTVAHYQRDQGWAPDDATSQRALMEGTAAAHGYEIVQWNED